jgi:hypothetical protein
MPGGNSSQQDLDEWFLNSVAFCGGLGGNDDELSMLDDPFA